MEGGPKRRAERWESNSAESEDTRLQAYIFIAMHQAFAHYDGHIAEAIQAMRIPSIRVDLVQGLPAWQIILSIFSSPAEARRVVDEVLRIQRWNHYVQYYNVVEIIPLRRR